MKNEGAEETHAKKMLASMMPEDAQLASSPPHLNLVGGPGGYMSSEAFDCSLDKADKRSTLLHSVYKDVDCTTMDSTLDTVNHNNSMTASARTDCKSSLIDPSLFDLYQRDDRAQTHDDFDQAQGQEH